MKHDLEIPSEAELAEIEASCDVSGFPTIYSRNFLRLIGAVRRARAESERQQNESERLREELGLLCDRLVDNARAVRLRYRLEAGS